MCARMFTITLFIIAKNGKVPKGPSMGQWINIIKYYSLMKQKDNSNTSSRWQSQDLSSGMVAPEPHS